MEDLEQIFLRSWRESHLAETRQYQPPPCPPCPPAPGPGAPVTSAQLPWLAGLAASSCNDSVHIIECASSLAEGLAEMFRLLVEGKLAKTNYVVIICACRSAAIDSCIAVTGEALRPRCPLVRLGRDPAGGGRGVGLRESEMQAQAPRPHEDLPHSREPLSSCRQVPGPGAVREPAEPGRVPEGGQLRAGHREGGLAGGLLQRPLSRWAGAGAGARPEGGRRIEQRLAGVGRREGHRGARPS